ncbi:MAG: ATP-binding protein, partial [Candidatus Bipolaricaulia bacterium]
AKRASAILDPERLLAEAAAEIQRSFNYYDVLIFSVDHERQELVRRAWAGHYSRRGPKDARLPLSERGLLSWVARHGQTALVNDVRSDPRYEAFFPETRSELCVPMKRDGVVIGGINVESTKLNAFDEADAIVLEALADQLVVALANAELYRSLEEKVAQRTAELEAERDRLQFVTEAMGAGLALISKDYRTIWANDYLKEIFGEVEGKPCYEAYNRQPEVRPWCAVREVFETGQERVETEAVGKDQAGRTIWFKLVATPLRDDKGEIIATLEVVMPITERKLLEEALRSAQERLQALSRVALKIQGVLDEEGLLELATAELARAGFRFTFWAVEGQTLVRRYSSIPSAEIKTLYGLLGSEPAEFRVPLAQSPLAQQALEEHRIIASTDLGGSLLFSRLYHSHPELIEAMEERTRGVLYAPLPLGGAARWFIAAPLARMDQEELGALELFIRHLSTALENAHLFHRLEASYEELKRAQEGLLRAERLATLGQLAGAIAHNLRNPLGVIKNSAFYLKAKLRGREAREHLELIEQQVERADRRIADLLSLAYQRPLSLKRVELQSLIARLLEQLDLPEGIELSRAFPAEPLSVEADPEQLLQACQNVVVNAIEALGGRGELRIRAYPMGSEAVLEFEDKGPGLPPEEAARVFEPLFTTKAQGTGLGLTITKQIIEAHRGRISFESEPGRGSRVTIRLPRKGD